MSWMLCVGRRLAVGSKQKGTFETGLQRLYVSGSRPSRVGSVGGGGQNGLLAVAALFGCGALAYTLRQQWPSSRVAGPRPTDLETLDSILDLLQETPIGRGSQASRNFLFADLGSGDGRVVIAAVQRFGCRGVGVDVMEESVAESRAAAQKDLPADLAARTLFLCADMSEVDLAEVDVLFVYLPQALQRQVVLHLLPRSGLRNGAAVLIEDAPKDFCSSASAFGFRHVHHGGVLPPSPHRPALDLFEWRGSSDDGSNGASAGQRPMTPLERRKAERAEASRALQVKVPLWSAAVEQSQGH